MNSQTWKHVSSEPSEKRSRRGRMGQVGPNLQSTTFHKIHLQWTKVCVPLLDELWGSLAILHIFWKTKSGHLLKTLSPTYDAIIVLLLLVKGLKIDHCFLTYWWGLPNSPLSALSRKELGDTQHVHPTPKIFYPKWSWMFTFLHPHFASQWNSTTYKRRWGFSSFILPLNPN